MQLNHEQKRAVITTDRPLLILAGAGSGKTRVITNRIAHLVTEKGVMPDKVLAVTFTNKAAGELKERLHDLLGDSASRIWASTFHSMCARILRRYAELLGYGNNFVIYDENDQLKIARKVLADEKEITPGDLVTAISTAKDSGLCPDRYRSICSGSNGILVSRYYKEYQKMLIANNAVDFGDLLMLTVKLFKDHPGILTRYQDLFQYIMVDEYQDTNHIQYELVNMLAARYRNLCVVGDDDQSIYAFRNADIRNILDFEKDYPDATVIKLEQNYRSTKNIINGAVSIIKHNVGRKSKTMWTDADNGDLIEVMVNSNEYTEASRVAQKIREFYSDFTWHDFAVLYRTNFQSRVFEEIFLRSRIPYEIIGGIGFYDRAEIKDILAYLKVIANPADSISLKRIINTPARGIGETTIGKIEDYARDHGLSMYNAIPEMISNSNIKGKIGHALSLFHNMMSNFISSAKELSLTDLVRSVVVQCGLIKVHESSSDVNDRAENIKEFVTLAAEFEELSEAGKDIQAFLDHVALMTGDNERTGKADRVALMTIHAAKGLEFPVVFIVGFEEGLLPHCNNSDLEEERRLCYVGMTRAMEKLFITNAMERMIFGKKVTNPPSRFLNEIPSTVLDWSGKYREPTDIHQLDYAA